MRTVLQRVRSASVRVGDSVVGQIEQGALLLVGVEVGDTEADADATAKKIAGLRFFPGATPMDKTLRDVDGACLVVSQFTLAGSVRKGNRPSFTKAAPPELAVALYERVAARVEAEGIHTETGTFRADMQVELVNDGPITLFIFTENGRIVS